MDYYIAPDEPETDFLRISRPEDIRICDPACGSGHMLTYAFDLLHAIYEEEGYDAAEIPALILTHNLHGIEIDDRAGALAAFALAMKAAAKLGRRRFLRLARAAQHLRVAECALYRRPRCRMWPPWWGAICSRASWARRWGSSSRPRTSAH